MKIKLKQRVFGLLLCAAMLFSLCPAFAFAQAGVQNKVNVSEAGREAGRNHNGDRQKESTVNLPADEPTSGTFGDTNEFSWELNDEGTLTITGTGEMPNFNWNSAPWYTHRDKVKKVIIKKDVTTIGNNTFYNCENLVLIELPASLTTIGDYAFDYCKNLVSIKLPAGLTTIGDYAFDYCKNLVSIKLPADVTTIGEYAFYECEKLELSELPAGVKTIGKSAFESCENLALSELPAGMTTIGAYAFYNCSNLAQIELPDGVTTIGNYAFAGCSSLTELTFTGKAPPTLGEGVFNRCNKLTTIYVPEDSKVAYINADFPSGKVQGYTPYFVTVLLTEGGTVSASQTINVRENKTITLTAEPETGCQFVNWEVTTNSDNEVEVTIDPNNSTTATFTMPTANVTVKAVFKAIITVEGNGSFGEQYVGYTDAPAARTFTIKNESNTEITGMDVSLSDNDNDSFALSADDVSDTLAADGEVNFTVQPNTGLAEGHYTATVEVTGDNCISRQVPLSFTVNKKSGGGSYIPPTPPDQNPSISQGEGYTTQLSDRGKTLTITVLEDYELLGVSLNGQDKGAVTTLSGLKTGDKVEITVISRVDQIKAQLAKVNKKNFASRSELVKRKNGKKAIKIYFKNSSGVTFDGIEVFRSAKKNTGYGTKAFFTTKTEKYINTAVKKGNRYFYKSRGYIEYKGTKYYSAWSAKAWRTVK